MALRYWRNGGDDNDGIFPSGTRGLDNECDFLPQQLATASRVATAVVAAAAFTANLGWSAALDREELPAGKLFGQAEEDFWRNPVAPVQATMFRWLPADEDVVSVAPVVFAPGEVFWQPPAPQVQLQPKQPISDAEDAPSLFGQPDEDYWVSGVAPTQAGLYRDLIVRDAEDAPLLFGLPDEDGWGPPPPAQSAVFRQQFVDDDLPVFVPPPPAFDEDFWVSGVAPVQASVFQPFPYQPDPEEIPAGSLIPPTPPPSRRYAIFCMDD